MSDSGFFSVEHRSQTLVTDSQGYQTWEERTKRCNYAPGELAVIVCDVWDRHWCRGAEERLTAMLPGIAAFLSQMREGGMKIIHAPSDTMEFYRDHPARERILAFEPLSLPVERKVPDQPLPIDDSDGGCDTVNNPAEVNSRVWSCQHPLIPIDPEWDVISDRGQEIYTYIKRTGIKGVLILGVHLNMCVLHRSFGIKQMVRWGVDISLVRDLTDTMYSPVKAPYVSHRKGTELVVDYIEKFWCSTLSGLEILSFP